MRSALLAGLAATALAQTTEWPAYGNDAGGSRYSPAKAITIANVSRLKQAWLYNTGALARAGKQKSKMAFEATPIFVEGTLYLSTPLNRVSLWIPKQGRKNGLTIRTSTPRATIRK